MTDEFTNNVAQRFPNTQGKEYVERPWDVAEPQVVTFIERLDEGEKEDVADRIHGLYSELRASLTVRSAVEVDLRRACRILEEVNRVKAEVEKIVGMLRKMENFMKENIK